MKHLPMKDPTNPTEEKKLLTHHFIDLYAQRHREASEERCDKKMAAR
jgi:hypothetical protein